MRGRVRDNTDSFIRKAVAIHGNKYKYEQVNYIKSNEKVKLICPEHGAFYQIPASHLSGRGCKECGYENNVKNQTWSATKFIKESIKKHSDRYDYSTARYINTKTEVEILCPKHGIFKQTPSNHLLGHGCPKCGTASGQFCPTLAERNKIKWSKTPCTIYLVEIDTEFLKLGITTDRLSRRLKGINFEVLSKQTIDLYSAIYKEKALLEKFITYSYEPKILFPGHTECFKLNIKSQLLKELNKI